MKRVGLSQEPKGENVKAARGTRALRAMHNGRAKVSPRAEMELKSRASVSKLVDKIKEDVCGPKRWRMIIPLSNIVKENLRFKKTPRMTES